MAQVGRKLLGVLLSQVDATQQHELGLEVKDQNGKTYRYIRAGAAIAANDALKIDFAEGYNDLQPTAAADEPIAGVSEVAIADNYFGWVVVGGPVAVKAAATVVAGAPAVPTATAGTLDDTAAAVGNALAAGSGVGAIFLTTTTSGLATVYLH